MKTATQKKGTILPVTAAKPTLEVVKITKEMKVRCWSTTLSANVAWCQGTHASEMSQHGSTQHGSGELQRH